MTNNDNLLKTYEILLSAYGPRNWWPARTPYEMMVGAILTQNTTWDNVKKAITSLDESLTPDYIAKASNEELADYIRPSGYYNQKATKLKALTEWFKKYSYDAEEARKADGEDLREELLRIKGVGRETADSILTYALDKPFFVVDAYTRRIMHRLGYDLPRDYDDIRLIIEQSIPRDLYIYNEFHALIVEHAKRHCRKKPSCEACPLLEHCQRRD